MFKVHHSTYESLAFLALYLNSVFFSLAFSTPTPKIYQLGIRQEAALWCSSLANLCLQFAMDLICAVGDTSACYGYPRICHWFWLSVSPMTVNTSEFQAADSDSLRFTGVTVKRFAENQGRRHICGWLARGNVSSCTWWKIFAHPLNLSSWLTCTGNICIYMQLSAPLPKYTYDGNISPRHHNSTR